jgi:hypothetical protein
MRNYIHSKVNPRNSTVFTPYELGLFVRGVVQDCANMVETKHGPHYALELRELLVSDEAHVSCLDIAKASVLSR